MENQSDFNLQKAMAMAGTPAGRQLLALLQKNGGQELQQAMNRAAAGDYEAAKQALSGLLASPEAQALLKKLGG